MMLGVSYGTASVLKLNKAKSMSPPTTAYIIAGEQCTNACSFCCRWKASEKKLSRVTWPLYEENVVVDSINEAHVQKKLSRVCFQITNDKKTATFEKVCELIKKIKNNGDILVSVSSSVNSAAEAEKLFSAGADNVAIPLDASTKELFFKIKKSDWEKKINLITEISAGYPWKVTTHIIAGLGETQEDAVKILDFFHTHKVVTGLFAFTPVKGSDMEHVPPPEMNHYRKIQLAHWLLKNNLHSYFSFKEGIIEFDKKIYKLLENINSAENIFRTSGCSFCNRPFYNEKPGDIPYNYPEIPTPLQTADAIEEAVRKH